MRKSAIFDCLVLLLFSSYSWDCSWTRIWIAWCRYRSSQRRRCRRSWRRAIASSSSFTNAPARE